MIKPATLNKIPLLNSGILIFLLFLTGFGLSAQSSQAVYSTMYGKMVISGQVGDSTLMMQTNRLTTTLNYESAEFVIRLDPKSLTQKNEILKAPRSYQPDIFLRGKLGLDYVITEKHPPLDFEVEGYLIKNGNDTRITGTGHLEHIFGETYACVLNMDFEVPSHIMNIEWSGDNNVQIKMHTILNKEN